jgi:hypothetical protein
MDSWTLIRSPKLMLIIRGNQHPQIQSKTCSKSRHTHTSICFFIQPFPHSLCVVCQRQSFFFLLGFCRSKQHSHSSLCLSHSAPHPPSPMWCEAACPRPQPLSLSPLLRWTQSHRLITSNSPTAASVLVHSVPPSLPALDECLEGSVLCLPPPPLNWAASCSRRLGWLGQLCRALPLVPAQSHLFDGFIPLLPVQPLLHWQAGSSSL